MALVACKECQKDVSTKAAKCPNCGVRLKANPMWVVLWVVAGLLAAFFLFGALASRPSRDAAAAFQPEQAVYVSDSAFGCTTLSQLAVALGHYNKQQYSAWGAATRKPSCFSFVKDSGEWTVYQVGEGVVQIGKATHAQYSAASERDEFDPRWQYWVPAHYISATPKPKPSPETPAPPVNSP